MIKKAKNKGMTIRNQFAASGSCSAPEKIIKGAVNGTTFISEEFTGTMDSQKFWDDLRHYAKRINSYVILVDNQGAEHEEILV